MNASSDEIRCRRIGVFLGSEIMHKRQGGLIFGANALLHSARRLVRAHVKYCTYIKVQDDRIRFKKSFV